MTGGIAPHLHVVFGDTRTSRAWHGGRNCIECGVVKVIGRERRLGKTKERCAMTHVDERTG